MMAAVFSMQGGGQFAAALVALLTTIGFRKSFSTASDSSTCVGDCQLAANQAWRIIIGAGAFPALFALYYRITVPETPRFTFDVAQDIGKADADIKAYIDGKSGGIPNTLQRVQIEIASRPLFTQPRASWSDFRAYFGNRRNGTVLFATMASWFFVDFAFYGLGLNNSTVLAVIGYSSGSNIYQILYNTAVGNLILVCAGSIPGYWLSVLTVDHLGRRPIQIGGFVILTIIFCIIGFGYNSLSKPALLALYIMAQFFFNFGPNTTTFIIPGECFPTRYRSTGHGLSAASGKLGATIAQVIAQPLLGKGAPANCTGSACSPWLNHMMEIFACFMLCGTLVSFFVPETKRQTLEVLAGEAPFGAREGSKTTAERQDGLISTLRKLLGLGLHSSAKKEIGMEQKKNDKGDSGKNDDDQFKNHASSISTFSKSSQFQPHRLNENAAATGISKGQYGVEYISLRDVGNLLG
jgi:MFS transporter, PHS family, inorganic phosphate transporter